MFQVSFFLFSIGVFERGFVGEVSETCAVRVCCACAVRSASVVETVYEWTPWGCVALCFVGSRRKRSGAESQRLSRQAYHTDV